MTLRLSVLLCLFLLIVSCEGPLPKATQDGRNIFACKLNGKKWEPDGGGGLFSQIKPISGGFITLNDEPKQLGIFITATKSNGERIQIFVNQIKPGLYQLNQDALPTASLTNSNYGYVRNNDRQLFMTSPSNIGQVVINKVDTVTGVIAGQFYFKAGPFSYVGQPSHTGIMTVSEGRFDIKSPL